MSCSLYLSEQQQRKDNNYKMKNKFMKCPSRFIVISHSNSQSFFTLRSFIFLFQKRHTSLEEEMKDRTRRRQRHVLFSPDNLISFVDNQTRFRVEVVVEKEEKRQRGLCLLSLQIVLLLTQWLIVLTVEKYKMMKIMKIIIRV